MISFAKDFTQSPVQVIKMENYKFAVVEEGQIKVLLSCESSVPDAAIIENLKIIHGAFKFYNISFAEVRKKSETSRKHLLEDLDRICSQLLPLIKSLRNNSLRAFPLLSYTELSSVSRK